MGISDSTLTDRSEGSIHRQLAEALHDVFGEEHPLGFFFAANRVIADKVDNMDVGRMDSYSVRKSKDIYEFVSKYVHVNSRQCGCCRPRRRRWHLSETNVPIDVSQGKVGF